MILLAAPLGTETVVEVASLVQIAASEARHDPLRVASFGDPTLESAQHVTTVANDGIARSLASAGSTREG